MVSGRAKLKKAFVVFLNMLIILVSSGKLHPFIEAMILGCSHSFLFIAFNTKANIFYFSEPYVTEEELKLMLRGAELSGAIEEEEQVIYIGFNSNNIIAYLFSKFSALSLLCVEIKFINTSF